MEESKWTEARIRELDQSAWQREILRHTEFLGAAEQAVYDRIARELRTQKKLWFGGYPEADRRVLCFLPEYLEFPETNPAEKGESGSFSGKAAFFKAGKDAGASFLCDIVSCIHIRPRSGKFADRLSHRDFLGALMNLGIERAKLGDILTDGTEAYLFCMTELAPYLCAELSSVKHTAVDCEIVPFAACTLRPLYEELSVNVASERLDAVAAAVFRLSRAEAAALIDAEKVFVSGRGALSAGSVLKEGERVSVRGYGKFEYGGLEGFSKKGRLYVKVKKFV